MEIFSLIINILILLFTFYALARIVDIYFVETLEIISQKLKLSSDIAGATFMAVGSSAPELFVAIIALLRPTGSEQLGAGTIVGSAIFNILVIVGASAAVKTAQLTWQPVIRDLFFYSAAIVLLIATFADGQISVFDASLYVIFYFVYLMSFKVWRKLFPYSIENDIAAEVIELEEQQQAIIRSQTLSLRNSFDKLLQLFFFNLAKRPGFYVVNFLISIILIAITSHFMVDSAVHVAELLNIPNVIIGLTILAAGTSIPDLLSSINVAKRGYGDMAVSNAVGSNIFDIAIGLGLPWLLFAIFTGEQITVGTENLLGSTFLLFATVVTLLFVLIAKRWKIGRYSGWILILLYVAYVAYNVITTLA